METKCLSQSAWEVKEICSWESNWNQLGIPYIKGELWGIFRAWSALQWLHKISHGFCGFIPVLLSTHAQHEKTRITLLCEFSFFELIFM